MFYIWSQEQLKLWLWSQRSKKGRISQNTDVTCDCVQICFRSSTIFVSVVWIWGNFVKITQSQSAWLCISSVPFLTQSHSATVYFICMITQSQSATVYFICMKAHAMRLYFVSLWFFTQSQSATVYFFCTISYTVAVCDCVFLLYDFFLLLIYTVAVCDCVFLLYDFFLLLILLLLLLLSTLQSLIFPTWLNRFWPDLVTSIGWPSPFMSHDQIRVKGHVGVTGVKKVIFTKNATPPTNYVAWLCDLCMW